ncbi:MAG TPA: serine hydrolase domain-containing protein, partial [Planctomycetota bacterium]
MRPHPLLRPALALLAACPLALAQGEAFPRKDAADPFPPLALAADDPTRAALELLSAQVKQMVADDACVGAELHVIRGRRTLLHEVHGWAHREEERPLELDSIFCVRSMTKPLVGTLVQMLLDEGELSLGTRAAEILPAFDAQRLRDVTLEQLLTHTSGLPFSTIARPLASYGSIADVAGEAAARGLEHAPGSFHYSDAGADTLGAIAAAVDGAGIAELVQQRILEPLGMTESLALLPRDGPLRARVPSAYSGGPGAWKRHWGPNDEPIFPLFLTSQGLYATTSDYARFLALWMDGGRVGGRRLLSAAALERGLAPRNPLPQPGGFRGIETHYGQQWIVYREGERPWAFGHNGSDGTYAWAWPERDLMVLLFTQSRGSTCGLALETALQELLIDGDVAGFRERARRSEAARADLGRFDGLYLDETNRRAYYVVSSADGLLTIERPGKFHARLTPTAEDGRFVLEGSTTLTFEDGGDGPSPAFLLPQGARTEREVRHVPDPGLPAAEEVLEHVRAAHGTEHLAELGAVRLTGTITLPQRKLSGTVELLFDAQRYRLVVDLGVTRESVWMTADGRIVTQSTGADPVEAEGSARADALATHPLQRLGGWDRAGHSVEVLRRIAAGDGHALLLRVTAPGAPGASKLIEEETGLLRFEDRLEHVPGVGLLGVEITYGDFREVGAARLPFAIRSKYAFALLGEIHVQYEEVELGVEVG